MANRQIQIIDPKFTQLKAESNQESNKVIETDDNLGQDLSFLLAYDYSNNEWTRVICDTDGRVLVSSGATKTDEASHSTVASGAASALLLNANPNRRAVYIQNIGSVAVFLGYGVAAVIDDGIKLASGATFIDDLFIGSIYVISSVACDVLVTELT